MSTPTLAPTPAILPEFLLAFAPVRPQCARSTSRS